MPKMTLLDMTQNILSAMDSDAVNSISDTVEALQVAEVIRETYYEILAGIATPSQQGLIQLEPLGSTDRPNYLRVPDSVKNIEWVKYDYRTDGQSDYKDVTFLEPQDFLRRQSMSTDGIEVIDFSGVTLWCRTDQNPRFWTTFDNEYLVFDGFDNTLDSTLQNSKSMCWGQTEPTFILDNEAIPDLDIEKFPLLLAEAKAVCFINFKGVSSSKEEQRAKRQRIKGQSDLWRLNQRKPYNRLPDYGRRRG